MRWGQRFCRTAASSVAMRPTAGQEKQGEAGGEDDLERGRKRCWNTRPRGHAGPVRMLRSNAEKTRPRGDAPARADSPRRQSERGLL